MNRPVAVAEGLEDQMLALFPRGCVRYDYPEDSGLEGGPCSVVALSVSLALSHIALGKITEEQALARVRATAEKVIDSQCPGMFLKEEPGCFADPIECGQNAESFGEYVN